MKLFGVIVIAVLLAGCRAQGSTPPPHAAAGPAADSSAVRDVLRRYYEAIGAREYRTAYALWAQDGAASRQTYEEFAAGFGGTARTGVEFTGPVTFGGAAGSTYATVPVRVRAATTTGEQQEFVGVYVLRRANDIPGATPEQLRWHVYGAKLEPVD